MAVRSKNESQLKVKQVVKGSDILIHASYNDTLEKLGKQISIQPASSTQSEPYPQENVLRQQKMPGIPNSVYIQSNRSYGNTQNGQGQPDYVSYKADMMNEIKTAAAGYGLPIANQMGQFLKLEAREFVKEAQEGATGGLVKSKEYRMAAPISDLGRALVVDIAMQAKNEGIIRGIQSGNTESGHVNIQDLRDVHSVLVKQGITANSKFRFRNEKDFKALIEDIDVMSMKHGYGRISKMNTSDLKALKEKISTPSPSVPQIPGMPKSTNPSGNSDIIKAIDLQIMLKSGKSGGLENINRNFKSVKRSLKRIFNKTVDDTYTYRGYVTTKQYTAALKAVTKAISYEGRLLYKGSKSAGKGALHGTEFVLRKMNKINAADNVANFYSKAGEVAHLGENLYAKAVSAPKNIKTKIRGEVSKGKIITKNKTRNVSARTSNKIVSSRTGRTASKIVNRKFLGTNIKSIGKSYLRVQQSPIKFTKYSISTLSKVKSGITMKFLAPLNVIAKQGIASLAKLAAPALLLVMKISIILGAFMAVIMAITTIGDAVSSSLEKFKTETTMGATYAKLLEKEQEFNAAVADLINDPVPESYNNEYAISKYTNSYVHYIGPDGKELFNGGYDVWVGTPMDPDEVSDEIWTYLKSKGWSNIHIAGLLGNFAQESSMDPTAFRERQPNSKGGHFSDVGLAQWTDSCNASGVYSVKRFTGYMNYAASKGKPYYDIKTQLNYLLYDEPGWSNVATSYKNTSFSTAADAATYWMNEWEKPDPRYANEARRRYEAESYFAHYKNGAAPADPDADPDEENGSTEDFTQSAAIHGSNYSTSTIKGILSMAAVYIEQDFKKYGAYTDKLSIFDDSVYKDYCAKLYDATHIIGKDATPPVVYYCPALSPADHSDYHAATEACNNKIPKGATESSDSSITRPTSATYTYEEDSYDYDCGDENCGGHTEEYDRYTIHATGPHGMTTYNTSDSSGRYEKNEMQGRGCNSLKTYVLQKDDDSTTYAIVCSCAECRGHIDSHAYVFVSNIYDPSMDVSSSSDETEVEEDGATDDEGTDNSDSTSHYNDDGFNNIERKDVETRFSMYALDKYATAFDAPYGYESNLPDEDGYYNEEGHPFHILAPCPNDERMCQFNLTFEEGPQAEYSCSVCLDKLYLSGSEDSFTIINNMNAEINNWEVCSSTGQIITDSDEDSSVDEDDVYREKNPGDEESVIAADATGKRDAEKAIMEDLTGLPIEIKDWWKNDGWTESLATTKTYHRLYSEEESFDKLPVPEQPNEEGFQNVVNETNSTPYWFDAFTSTSGRNHDFERHGWDNDSISQVRLLMAADWTELYGITDFGYIQGSPLTDAQIAQLIKNNRSWEELCDDRKAIIANTILFAQVAQKLQLVYHQSSWKIQTMQQLMDATSTGQVVTSYCALPGSCDHERGVAGVDCSMYVGFILTNAGLYNNVRPSTLTIKNQIGSVFEEISQAELQPGDICLYRNEAKGTGHVLIYMGRDASGNILASEASGHKEDILFNQPKRLSGYRYLRLKSIDETKFTIDLTDITGGESEEDGIEEE